MPTAHGGDPRSSLFPYTRWLALVGMAGLLGLALLTCAEVLSRWLANAPIRGLENVIDVVVPIVVACALPSGLLHGQDVAIQFLGKLLGRRCTDVLELAAAALALAFYCLLAWQVFVYAGELAAGGRVTEIIKLPMAPWWWATSGLLAFCAIVQAAVLTARWRHFGTGRFVHLGFESSSGDVVASSTERGEPV
jgi:TRAP-type transport system small permease protein